MASYNPQNRDSSSLMMSSSVENKGLFSRLLRNLSSWGMKYDDMILKNTVGVNINEDPYSQRDGSYYDFFSQRAVANVLNRKSIPYLDRAYIDKRRILREYSIKDYLRDYVSRVAEETIIYSEKDFCQPKTLSSSYSQEIRDKYQEYFEKIYNRYGFNDGISAFNLMKDFLIDGYVAMEIVWDDKKQNIIHFNRLKPETLVPAYEPNIGNLWIQFPEDPQLRRIFLDSQIIFISYSTQNDYTEISYLEGLIKPYNQLKVIEQSRIMFNMINATLYQVFTIPVKGLPRQRAEEQIGQLISDYSEEVEWDDTLGTVQISGSKHLPYNKQYWFPESDAGTPNMKIEAPTGHNLNEDVMLTYFKKALQAASKIPFQRFDEGTGGGTIYEEISSMTRDEVVFGNFINRLRSIYKELVVKPIRLQMCMEFPELKDDEVFLNDCDIVFNVNQIFENWRKLSNMDKKVGIVTNLLSIMKDDRTYFHIDYLMEHIYGLSQEERNENERYWLNKKVEGSSEAGVEGMAPAEGEAPPTESPEGAPPPPEAGGEAPPEEPGGGAEGGAPTPEGGEPETEFEF
ncbi:hypothetical protein EBU71_07040 [bacterium]|nr:hypothetical protein [Candidatus Elulimicrobium humile]